MKYFKSNLLCLSLACSLCSCMLLEDTYEDVPVHSATLQGVHYGQILQTKKIVLEQSALNILSSSKDAGVRKKNALEITVQLDNGQTLIVIQDNDDFYIPGDRVRVMTSNDKTRVQLEK